MIWGSGIEALVVSWLNGSTIVKKRTLCGGHHWTCAQGPKWKMFHPRARVDLIMWNCSHPDEHTPWRHCQQEEASGQNCITIPLTLECFYGLKDLLPKSLNLTLLCCLDYGFQFGGFILEVLQQSRLVAFPSRPEV